VLGARPYERADVETGTDSDDEASDVIHAVKGIVNAEFVKAIRIHTHRQLQTRALGGFNPGGKAFGYTSIKEPNPADPKNPLPVLSHRTHRGRDRAPGLRDGSRRPVAARDRPGLGRPSSSEIKDQEK